MSTNRLETVAQFDGMTLYKRVAKNGSSAWAWVGGPAYVLRNSKGETVTEFDWQSDALDYIAKLREQSGVSEHSQWREVKVRQMTQGNC